MASKKKLGRSFLAGEVTAKEIETLVYALFESAGEVLSEEQLDEIESERDADVIVVDGALDIAGDFDTHKHNLRGLIVKGSLTIAELYEDHDEPMTGVYVLGDLHADRVITAASLGVKGALVAKQAVVGIGGDHMAAITGDLKTKVLFSLYHHFEVKGGFEGEIIGDPRVKQKKSPQPMSATQWGKRLVPEIVDHATGDEDDVFLDDKVIIARVRKGKPLLR